MNVGCQVLVYKMFDKMQYRLIGIFNLKQKKNPNITANKTQFNIIKKLYLRIQQNVYHVYTRNDF